MTRVFLFLQGPHGPFFWEVSRDLGASGAKTLRAGINRGDEAFWHDASSYVALTSPPETWQEALTNLGAREGVTDLVLYGDTRPLHRAAMAAMPNARVHVFEEGYLRPYWITYERGGANGNSRLMGLPLVAMTKNAPGGGAPLPGAPAQWGTLWHHSWYGCLYHANVLLRNRRYPNFQSHRPTPVIAELIWHLRRFVLIPAHAVGRRLAMRRLLSRGRPYHVALLQLEHDAAVQDHSGFSSMAEFIQGVVAGFAAGAPAHHELVFKAHPLEDGRARLRRVAREAARAAGIEARVHYHPGGKLANLIRYAESAVTINSTAGQQILWRGLPLRAFGKAVYDKPEFVSDQPLESFFAAPKKPDFAAYRAFRVFLLKTSQVTGGFYTREARATARRRLTQMMQQEHDPYDTLLQYQREKSAGTSRLETDSLTNIVSLSSNRTK